MVLSMVGAEGPEWVKHHTTIDRGGQDPNMPLSELETHEAQPYTKGDFSLQNQSVLTEGLQLSFHGEVYQV